MSDVYDPDAHAREMNRHAKEIAAVWAREVLTSEFLSDPDNHELAADLLAESVDVSGVEKCGDGTHLQAYVRNRIRELASKWLGEGAQYDELHQKAINEVYNTPRHAYKRFGAGAQSDTRVESFDVSAVDTEASEMMMAFPDKPRCIICRIFHADGVCDTCRATGDERLMALSPRQREAIRLTYGEGLSDINAGLEMGVSRVRVYQLRTEAAARVGLPPIDSFDPWRGLAA